MSGIPFTDPCRTSKCLKACEGIEHPEHIKELLEVNQELFEIFDWLVFFIHDKRAKKEVENIASKLEEVLRKMKGE